MTENGDEVPLPRPKKRRDIRKRPCVIAVGALLLLLFLLSITALVLALTVFKPKQPRTQILSATLDGVAPSVSLPALKVELNVTLHLKLMVENPNHASFKHGPGKTAVFYRGNQVGEADLFPGIIPASSSTTLPCQLTLEIDEFTSNMSGLISDVLGGKLVMETHTRIPGRVTLLKIFKKHINAISDCRLTVAVPELKVQEQECKHKTKL